MQSSRNEQSGINRICFNCVGETFLKDLIRRDGIQDVCDYCDEEAATISINELADHVERAFDEHYERTASAPDGWERDGEQTTWAIVNAAAISEEIAEDIRSILYNRHFDFELATLGEEFPFSEEAHYAEKNAGHGEFAMLWEEFETGLKTQTRFFSRSAKSILEQIFANLPSLRTVNGTSVIVNIGPETSITTLHRARVFAGEDEKLKEALIAPWIHLGTPPTHAAAAGRMNARGIAVFYGALDSNTALSEVRPPVGSKVAIARFNILRPLQLLDISSLQAVAAGGSVFDPATLVQMQRGNFLEILSWRMSRAVMPHEEASEYLPTQAVADYLAIEAGLDGMIYPSVQAGHQSTNVVLFHHASRIERVILPAGTNSTAHLVSYDSDGAHPDYSVWEKVPALPASECIQTNQQPDAFFDFHDFHNHTDHRHETLSVDLDNIHVLHINAVSFGSDIHLVSRCRFEQMVTPGTNFDSASSEFI